MRNWGIWSVVVVSGFGETIGNSHYLSLLFYVRYSGVTCFTLRRILQLDTGTNLRHGGLPFWRGVGKQCSKWKKVSTETQPNDLKLVFQEPDYLTQTSEGFSPTPKLI